VKTGKKKRGRRPARPKRRRNKIDPNALASDLDSLFFGGGAFLSLAFLFFRAFIPNFDEVFGRIRAQMRLSSEWRNALGFTLQQPVTSEQVVDRFRELAKKHHPDTGGDHEHFVKLVAARDAALVELNDGGF
jgi:hypothetical protein